jgi:hypothetical protein
MTGPYGFGAYKRIMGPVIWLMDLILKLFRKIGGKRSGSDIKQYLKRLLSVIISP